jgi:hypothetical protein
MNRRYTLEILPLFLGCILFELGSNCHVLNTLPQIVIMAHPHILDISVHPQISDIFGIV